MNLNYAIALEQPLRLEIKRKLAQRSERVKSVDLHPTEPWILASLYSGNVCIWNYQSQALSEADFLASLPSPFYNLKIVKLPPGYEESNMSCSLRTYLLGVSPKDTIVTTLPQVCVESIAILFHYYNAFVVLLFCRCKSCNQEMTAEDAEDWMYNQMEDTTHLLNGVVHSNGNGHLLRVNGREGGSRVLSDVILWTFGTACVKYLQSERSV
ncbi:hypothetical protein POM88_050437 [Heracleum sosnowskyi]|uniref:Uncharacterized protein n=1 Tax=Heracleum sosnowskyi TaxID=360622 RepID=A0AAD8M1I0_9APIA|nr:hypothetical protein POM88_050437 [Heracleum sosnowskyi]